LFPGNIIPDGQGGVLATWTIANATPPAAPQPYQAAYVSAGAIVATYPLPNAPTSLVTGPDGLPVNPPLVLGENGTAFASYGPNVTSFNLSAGSTTWNYQNANGISSASYKNGGGLTVIDGQSNQIQVDSSGNAGIPVALTSFSFLQATWNGDWQGAIPGSNAGLARVFAQVMQWGPSFWGAGGGSPSPSNTSFQGSWFPSLDHCTTPPGCIGHYEAIYNSLGDLIARLNDPTLVTGPKGQTTLADLAQTQIFDKLGTDESGNKFTTRSFLNYLNNNPRFYDGTQSTYCYNSLGGVSESLCFNNPFLHFFQKQVKDIITVYGENDASAGTPSKPLLVFFRPNAIGFTSLGKNLGNEGMIFHEALHGLTGEDDDTLEKALGIDPNTHASCSITVRIQNSVLIESRII
jgi:hypothetical protein